MITYDDKVALYENTDIANINKVTAGDMNEIKNVVNGMIESGSNNNGRWIKYSDGTMICLIRAERTVSYQASGSLYVGYLTNIVFPQTFTLEYTPMCFAQNNGLNEIITGQIEGVSATGITRIQCWRASAASTYTILNILAIGRWK